MLKYNFNSKRTWLTFGIVAAWYVHSCTTPQNVEREDAFQLDEERSDGLDEQSQVKTSAAPSRSKLAHPAKPDAWHTRKAIMMYAQPSPELILECKEMAENQAAVASNLRALSEASITLEGRAAQNRRQYHWCFYQLVTDLDLRLERESPLLTEKSEYFLARMKVLWVLAKALDSSQGTAKARYSTYLRSRYIEISQNQFGRNIEVMDPEGLLVTTGDKGKAAGSYEGP
ncbi:MAG: hypothetical protein NTV34_20815 [Proteobacteria bacterium]|nr:hypothetical protein [Pseudomonadota bacterium]